MSGNDEELGSKDFAAQVREALHAESNEEALELLKPHLPGIAKPVTETGEGDTEK